MSAAHAHLKAKLAARTASRPVARGGGARLLPRSLPCAHEGRILAPCHSRGSEQRHVRDCEVHGTCTRVEAGKDVDRVCATCADYRPGPVVVVDHGGNGIGDALPGLLATAALKRENPDALIDYRVSAAAAPWVRLFTGYDALGVHARDHSSDPTPGARQMNVGYPQEWSSRFAGGSRVARYCRNVGAKEPVLPALREPERVRALGEAYKGAVFLAPFSQHSGREWPLDRWLALERDLRGRGVRTVVAHSSADRCDRFVSELAVGFPPDRLAGAFLNASLVVGNDSGPAHLAGILGVPTVVVAGGYPAERIFGEYARVTCVGGGSLGAVSVGQVVARIENETRPATYPEAARLLGKLGQRARSMSCVVGVIRHRFPEGARVVETGCIRSPEDWSAGYATYLFGMLLDALGCGSLTTVDINPAHLATARNLCRRWSRIEYVESCSVAYLEARTEPIDVAYLDSLDTYEPGCAEHGLREAMAAEPLVSPRGLIVFDDTPRPSGGGWSGKGATAVPWLVSRGWRVLPASGYQTILERQCG